jgi:hypothetical protein
MTSAAKIGPIEYAIYTFDLKKPNQKADMFWRRHIILSNAEEAISQAQALSQSHKFEKVEVKKKFFDPKQNRMVNVTMKVFQTRSNPLTIWMIAGASCLCVLSLLSLIAYTTGTVF